MNESVPEKREDNIDKNIHVSIYRAEQGEDTHWRGWDVLD